MPWTPERSTANTKVQLGIESTSALGTVVAANKLLNAWDWKFGIEADVHFFRASGRKYPTVAIENTEWISGSVTGPLDYNHAIYALASAMGSVTPTAHLASATAKDWTFTPPVSGSIVPQTYSIEQGDSVRAHKFGYGLFTGFGYKATRKDTSFDGKLIAQQLTDGITMTGSPTSIALSPVAAKHWNVYLDPTSGALGTTQLLRPLSVDFNIDNIYAPFWVLNRSNLSWGAHVDLVPKATFKLKVEADSVGMGLLSSLQGGTTQFIRFDAQGSQIASDGPGAIFAEFKHDVAVKFGKPSPFEDDQGLFAIEWEGTVVEDATWAKSMQFVVTNLLTSL